MGCLRKSLIGLGFTGIVWAIGCGTPGAPQPPSLNLPQTVQDLSVNRVGDEIHLRWTMPRRNTDKLLLKGQYTAHLCLEEDPGKCTAVADPLSQPSAEGDYHYILPAPYAAGSPRLLTYRVEIRNHAGHSAGTSNPAVTLAGTAPQPVAGFGYQVRADGVAFHWTPASAESIRLHRVLLSSPEKGKEQKKEEKSPLNETGQEPAEQNLLVKPQNGSDPGQALDATALLDRKYRYTAARILQLPVQNKTIEISSAPSDTVVVDTRDTFPPNVPTGLVAVPVPEEKSIDLSWIANTDRDLAGYVVYRREEAASSPLRISPAQPFLAPSFRDKSGQSGHRYFYSISGVDRAGNESNRSAEVGEVFP